MVYEKSMQPHPWKVPARQVYSDTFGGWLKATAWCHIVRRLYPHASDMGA